MNGASANSRLSLFLMELIIALLFFALSAAICVRLFVAAHVMAEDTGNLSNAIMWSENLTEVFVNEKGDLKEIATLYPDAYVTYPAEDDDSQKGTLIIFFDDDWNVTEGDLTSASFEAIMETGIDDAANVYADVTDYGTTYKGKAAVGEVAIIDIKGSENAVSEIPFEKDDVIFGNNVDVYLGER